MDFEYKTARKDYKDCILHEAKSEVLLQDPVSLITKFVGIHNEDYGQDEINGMRCGVSFVFCHDETQTIPLMAAKQTHELDISIFDKHEFINFITGHDDIDIAYGQTQYNTKINHMISKFMEIQPLTITIGLW